MKSKELANLGVPKGGPMKAAHACTANAGKKMDKETMRLFVKNVVAAPAAYVKDEVFGLLAEALITHEPDYKPREVPAPWKQWGTDLEEQAVNQMKNACDLPVSVIGALMPDAHLGYGLPIGGVLATKNAVIPYAVGVDIACRMKMTVLDMTTEHLREGHQERLTKIIENETRFGMNARFTEVRRDHSVMDDKDWYALGITRHLKDKAWEQLGSSGGGNHFVEFGVLTVEEKEEGLDLEPGEYVALLSHSGSRGTGAKIASHYSKVAREKHPELPKELQYLAWLDLDEADGQEYWLAMELMGKYSAANHDCIHHHIAKALKVKVLADIENHHNFAWEQEHEGEKVIVHRKGATPAGEGVLGVIPGTMMDHAYIVRGKGNARSLHSASHGAGRRMSRTEAKKRFVWSEVNKLLKRRGVTLISAGIDESPRAYKDIDEVMSAQSDLVEPIARFQPKLVKMAPEDARARK